MTMVGKDSRPVLLVGSDGLLASSPCGSAGASDHGGAAEFLQIASIWLCEIIATCARSLRRQASVVALSH
jgi:hypothetical protein